MKMVKDKKLVVGADFAGFPLKEAVCEHLRKKGWEITDMGVKADSDPNDTDLMFHRVGLRVGAMISEGEFERALLFCGTGMGIHIAASKCPHVHAGVVENVPAALRAITANGVNVLTMGAFYVAPAMGCDIADAYLNAELGTGYEWWHNFYEFHKLAIDELEAFDYEEYKKNGFKVNKLGDFSLKLETKPESRKGEINVVRDAGIMKLRPGCAEEYEKRHNNIWPELVESIKSHGAKNYSIYLNKDTNELFSYLEIEDAELWEKRAGSEITKKWWDYMSDLMEVNPDNSPVFIPVREVFHLD